MPMVNHYIDPSSSALNEPFTMDEELRSIANLSVGKCSGIDGIPIEFLILLRMIKLQYF
jgi:hypothetical protein